MTYFEAFRKGELRSLNAQQLLTQYSATALPAILLRDKAGQEWVPVGEENLVTVTLGDPAAVVVCDNMGYAKAMTRPMNREEALAIMEKMKSTGLKQFVGALRLPDGRVDTV